MLYNRGCPCVYSLGGTEQDKKQATQAKRGTQKHICIYITETYIYVPNLFPNFSEKAPQFRYLK